MMALSLALVGLSLSLLGAPAWAHGVGYRASAFPAVALEFFYSTGEPMSYREARSFSPMDPKFAHDTGRTDEAGRFAFVPDVPGRWRVVVRDEEGHQATAELEIAEDALRGADASVQDQPVSPRVSNQANPPENIELFLRAILGVSLLFNIAAFVSLARRGRRAEGAA